MVHGAAPDPCIIVALALLIPLILSYTVDIWAKYTQLLRRIDSSTAPFLKPEMVGETTVGDT
jgi:hypothetical protein